VFAEVRDGDQARRGAVGLADAVVQQVERGD